MAPTISLMLPYPHKLILHPMGGFPTAEGPLRRRCLPVPHWAHGPAADHSPPILIPSPSHRRGSVGAPFRRWVRRQRVKWNGTLSVPPREYQGEGEGFQGQCISQSGGDKRRAGSKIQRPAAGWGAVVRVYPLSTAGQRRGGGREGGGARIAGSMVPSPLPLRFRF